MSLRTSLLDRRGPTGDPWRVSDGLPWLPGEFSNVLWVRWGPSGVIRSVVEDPLGSVGSVLDPPGSLEISLEPSGSSSLALGSSGGYF